MTDEGLSVFGHIGAFEHLNNMVNETQFNHVYLR
jgi:hypothetical protein